MGGRFRVAVASNKDITRALCSCTVGLDQMTEQLGKDMDLQRLAEVSSCFADSSNSVRDVFPDTKLLNASKYRCAFGPRFLMSWPLRVDVDDKDIVGVDSHWCALVVARPS